MAGWDKAVGALKGAGYILEDPALPQVVRSLNDLYQIEKGKPSMFGHKAPEKGVGLGQIVKPLQYFVEYRRRPWLGYLAVAGILVLPFVVGYSMGKRRRG